MARDESLKPNWNSRAGMMSEEEIEKLAAEKGKGAEAKVRADQAGQPGPQPHGDPSRRADQEAGPSGAYRRKKAEEESGQPSKPASEWTKYDWS